MEGKNGREGEERERVGWEGWGTFLQ